MEGAPTHESLGEVGGSPAAEWDPRPVVLSLLNDNNGGREAYLRGRPFVPRMPRKSTPRPKPAAHVPVHQTSTALVVRGGKVLLGKRTSEVRFAGMWDAFGGHREEGETPAHTLVRELFEELGIRVTAARFLHEYEDEDPTSKERYHHHLYLVTGWQGAPRIANEEHSELRWCTAEEATALRLQPHLTRTIREILSGNP